VKVPTGYIPPEGHILVRSSEYWRVGFPCLAVAYTQGCCLDTEAEMTVDTADVADIALSIQQKEWPVLQ